MIRRSVAVGALFFLSSISYGQTCNWDSHPGESIGLCKGEVMLWQFHFGPEEPKPYFHPIALADGSVVTWNRPPDHVWHHGLWFSWKYLNGLNYWEPDASGKPAGRTEWSDVEVATRDDFSARIGMKLIYRPPEADPVLTEQRSIEISSPDRDGGVRMDWTCEFTAGDQDVVFDRTPLESEPGGKPWGGYAGLSCRLAKDLAHRQAESTEGPVQFNDQSRFRGKALALDYHGTIGDRMLGVAICDHPKNLNHPSPWYVIRATPMSYFSPAVICYGPYTLKAGTSMKLQYRVIIHAGAWSADRLRQEYDQFVE